MARSRQNLFMITASVQLVPNGPLVSIGQFDKRSGGGAKSSTTKYRPGAQPYEVDLGGNATMDNITVSRNFDPTTDQTLTKQLMNRVGKAKAAISQQPITADFVPTGAPMTWTGTLSGATPPDSDSNSDSASMFEIEISVVGSVA